MLVLYKVDLTEYESGWGCRPDDIFLGKTYDEVFKIATEYCSKGSYQCYSRMNSEPYLIEVSEDLYNYVTENEKPIMLMRSEREKFNVSYGR